nr:histidine kinase [Hazenella coriacea]
MIMLEQTDYMIQVFNSLQDGIIIMNQNREILVMNPSAVKMTGWLVGEPVPYCTFCQKREVKKGENRCYLVAQEEVPYFLSQMPVYQGRKLEVEMSTAVIFHDPKTDEKEILLVLRDQTLKKKEEEARLSKMIIQKLIEAQENEHKRLAQELHDGVSQSLYSISIAMDAIDAHIDRPELKQYISEVKNELDHVITDVKAYSHQLRPQILDQLGLVAAIEGMVRSYQQIVPQVQFHFQADLEERLPSLTEINLFRVTQEALHNIMKYAQADQVCISLIKYRDGLYQQIKDNGMGFDPNQVKEGLGLKHMEERIDQLNGSIHIQSSPQGTTIYVWVPVTKEDHH